MDDRTGPDRVLEGGHHRLRPHRHLPNRVDEGANAQVQTGQRLEQALDRGEGQPCLFAHGGDQTHQPVAHAPLARHDPGQVRRWHATATTVRAAPLKVDMFGHHHLGWGQVDHFAGPFDTAPGQRRATIGTTRQRMPHLLRGLHPRPADAFGPQLAGAPVPPVGFSRLEPGHPPWALTWRLVVPGRGGQERADLGGEVGDEPPGRSLFGGQGRKLALLIGDGVALLKNDSDQVIAGGVVQIEHAPILRLRCPRENPSPQI